MRDATGTIIIRAQVLADINKAARINGCSVADQVERWIMLGRAVEAHPEFSADKVAAVIVGTAVLETLNALERLAFFQCIPGMFDAPSPEFVAAYEALSDDPNTGTNSGR